MRLRTLLRNGERISLLFSIACALFLSSRGCTLPHARRQTFRPPGMPSLLFASACCLFVVSLHSFLHSLPLFSIVWSLFPQNTRGAVPRTRFPLSASLRSLRPALSFALEFARPLFSYSYKSLFS